MNKFIWISGSINSGKSTVANLLHRKIGKTVNIELDQLSHFEHRLSLEEKARYIIQDGLDLANNWSKRGFIPILNWPLWGDEADYMLAYAKKSSLEPILINLTPSIEIVIKSRGERDLTERELNRINYMYHAAKIDTPKHGISIDNGNLTPEETVTEIIRQLEAVYFLNLLM